MAQHIRTASLEDVDTVCSIMNTVAKGITQSELFEADDRDFVARHIAEEGFTLLWQEKGSVCAFLIVRLPGQAPDNLGLDLALPQKHLERVAHMESTAVLPSFRGYGIQRLLMTEAEALLASRGFLHCLGTVHPDNVASLSTFLRLNYTIALTKEKYGGKLRHIMRKDL